MGDEQKEGGNVLRHFKDGVCLQVDGINFRASQAVGQEQGLADNQRRSGTSWIFVCHDHCVRINSNTSISIVWALVIKSFPGKSSSS
eukprot:SAG11_NODE_2105_length_3813_cov_2.468767_2_plen_87_part_00